MQVSAISLAATCAPTGAYQIWESSVKAGGASGTQALLAACGFGWVTATRVTVATAVLMSLAMVAVVLGTADRVLY